MLVSASQAPHPTSPHLSPSPSLPPLLHRSPSRHRCPIAVPPINAQYHPQYLFKLSSATSTMCELSSTACKLSSPASIPLSASSRPSLKITSSSLYCKPRLPPSSPGMCSADVDSMLTSSDRCCLAANLPPFHSSDFLRPLPSPHPPCRPRSSRTMSCL
ncbi:hypothetical protein C8F01DRAFT_1180487 [Mycena amicta]|nr:hypothetical protein C8F01DRAFT_1202595 [Mycena amicta]KAJ7048038.1 hypothetical protein C8F01DRAFT_1198809 [Mycena amicta]KAJ7050014.1 hypothetical protein C8F01DRAFT_1180487 [Mycena amicta]